ncbi:MAG: diguanylate cyclase [Guyparkeria sp.]|uniref:diguanylate cyclase n=1 Tax=Guyparkeria sp. TaxID=2035736 RepID=UPI00397D9F6B
MDQLQEAVLLTDSLLDYPGPTIIYANPAWERLTGYSASEVVGRLAAEVSGGEKSGEVIREMRDALSRVGFAKAEVINQRRDGSSFRMAVSVSAIDFEVSGKDASCYLAMEWDSSERIVDTVRQRQLDGLTRIQREAATGSLNLDYVRQRIADVAMEASGADAAVVEEVEDAEMVYRAASGSARDHVGTRIPIDLSASGRVYRNRESLHIRDVTEDRYINREAAEKVGFKSGIIVPLLHENRIFGVLKVYANETDRFADEDVQLLELASGVLAANLRRATEYASEERRRATLLDSLPALVAYVDKDLHFQEVNAAYESFHGLAPDSLRGKHLSDVLPPPNYHRLQPYIESVLGGTAVGFEVMLISGQGEERMMRGSYQPHFGIDGDIVGFYQVIQDVTEQNEAHVDYLTGLKNRREFERLGIQLLATAQRYEQPLGVIMVDLDRFKELNDSLGHLGGDEVLRSTSRLLLANSRDADVVGRWGGEEFMLLLPETNRSGTLEVAERIRTAIEECDFGVGRGVTASLGVTVARAEDDLETLQDRADKALYRAKREGRNQVALE